MPAAISPLERFGVNVTVEVPTLCDVATSPIFIELVPSVVVEVEFLKPIFCPSSDVIATRLPGAAES